MTLCKYTITYDYDGKTGVNNPNPTEYDVLNHVTLAEATVGAYKTFAWYTDKDFKNKIESTQGRTGDITIYARWVSADNNPTKLVTEQDIASIHSSNENDNGYALFDGEKTTTGLYADGTAEWFGLTGSTLTIDFNNELEVYTVYAYALGNWTVSEFTFYDASGTAVKTGTLTATDSENSSQNIILDLTTPIKVKTIEIKITSNKWDDWNKGRCHKISEVEIFVTNPDYTPE